MKDQKTMVKKEKKAKKQISKGKKLIGLGACMETLLPFTGVGHYFMAKGICMEVNDNIEKTRKMKEDIEQSEAIGKACDELIAQRKAEASIEAEPEEEINDKEES